MSVWRCSACGKEYEGVVENPPTFDTEEVAKRKARYERMQGDRLFNEVTHPQAAKEQQKVHGKIEREYFETVAKPRELMPAALTTEHRGAREYVIACAGGCGVTA